MPSFLLLLVLGAGNFLLLQDRWKVALSVYQTCPKDKCVFLFSGTPSELGDFEMLATAAKIPQEALRWEPKATNTAENAFFSLPLILEEGFSKVRIITSEFHKIRAQKIFAQVWKSYPGDISWQTGTEACPFCWSDETFHSLNIATDIASLR